MRRAVERLEAQRAAVRDAARSALARVSRQRAGDLQALPIAVVPANRQRLARLPARRRREFAVHLDEVIAEALRIRRKRTAARSRGQTPLPEMPPAGVATGCATCRGHCCRLGATHAFVDAATVQRLIEGTGTSAPRALARAFLQRLPVVSYRDSCVYHTRAGCNLPRAMRADICNRFYCGGLLEGWAALRAPPPPGFAIAAADAGALLRLTVVKEPQRPQTVRVGAVTPGPRNPNRFGTATARGSGLRRALAQGRLASAARRPYRDDCVGSARDDAMRLAFTVLSDVGRKRSSNEDAVHGRLDPRNTHGLLLVIADGMGGAAGGEVASRMAVETIDDVYFAAREASPAARLRGAILAANERIARAGQEQKALHGMGTTCTALAIAGATAYLGHVGDSRAYQLRGRNITRLTRDMSVWAERVRAGGLPSSEYGRNQLLEAVGLDPDLAPHMRGDIDVMPGDRFLLCSDGLWGLVTDPELAEIVDGSPLEDACRSLIDRANRRGAPDNVSVILAAVTD